METENFVWKFQVKDGFVVRVKKYLPKTLEELAQGHSKVPCDAL
jgi:hypothetical protein